MHLRPGSSRDRRLSTIRLTRSYRGPTVPPQGRPTDGHRPGETRTPEASLSTVFQRTSPVDGSPRPHPGRMAIPHARLAHHQPVSRLPSSAQVPRTAPTVPTPAGWAQRPRTRHSPASLATGSKDASPQTTAPTRPGGIVPGPSPHDSVLSHSIARTRARCHRTRTASRDETVRLPTARPPEASGLLARHKGLLSPYPPTRAHDSPAHPARKRPSRPPSLTPGRWHRTRTIVTNDSVLSHLIGGTPARCHRTRTTSTPPTRTRPESRARPRPMASHAEVRPLTRHTTASLDSHPAPTSRSPPHTRLLPLRAPVTRLDPTVPGPPPTS